MTQTTGQSAQVEIYTSPFCGFCSRAKILLEHKGVDYKEYNVFETPSHRTEMLQRANGRTSVPQIFIGGDHIGGSDELYDLEQARKLDSKLKP